MIGEERCAQKYYIERKEEAAAWHTVQIIQKRPVFPRPSEWKVGREEVFTCDEGGEQEKCKYSN